MTPILLTLAILAQPQCRAAPWEVHALVPHIQREERARHLPEGLLAAVVLVESGATFAVGTGRGPRGRAAAVGWAQILVPDWKGPAGSRLVWYLSDRRVSLAVAGMLLAQSRAWCRLRRCPCPWARYNWGGRRTWCRRVMHTWRRVVDIEGANRG